MKTARPIIRITNPAGEGVRYHSDDGIELTAERSWFLLNGSVADLDDSGWIDWYGISNGLDCGQPR